MTSFKEIQAHYNYTLPPELIAATPASPRDSARLLIYDRKTDRVTFDTFHNIGTYLPKNAVLVLNDTKVFPARMMLKKSTGGKIEALYLETTSKEPRSEHHRRGMACHAPTSDNAIRVIATGTFKAGEILRWEEDLAFTVIERNGKEATLQPNFPLSSFPSLLETHGLIPLPPYIEKSPLSEADRRREYQTVFARDSGSIAAPTAGLHFTKELLNDLRAQGINIEYVTLHVHLGTFAPLEESQWQKKELHTESYHIAPDAMERLNAAKKEERPIIAVGTTTVRTLESACNQNVTVGALRAMPLQRLNGSTSLFLTESSPLYFVDHLITNFHLPGTSLLMLVAAFTGREKLMELYKKATEERMRFYSFGDGMLVL
jgi:S-adenosylmethionine:tRNA ribosyltransferase-isomerase